MNNKLKFAWLNIIFFLALIFLGYVVYSGTCYKTQNELLSLAVACGCMLLILLTFYCAQLVKGADHKFERNIRLEVALLALCIPAFAACLLPFFWFWNVQERSDEVIQAFHKSVTESANVFERYEIYASNRIDDMAFAASERNVITRDNKRKILEQQLRPQAYFDLKEAATKWINENGNASVTPWNVFLVSNAKNMKRAVESWHAQLVDFSDEHLAGEPSSEPFDENESTLRKATDGFERLAAIYEAPATFSWLGVACAVLLFLMFLTPYLLQQRNTKSCVTLTHWKQQRVRSKETDLGHLDSKHNAPKKERKDATVGGSGKI